MKKAEQQKINELCIGFIDRFNQENNKMRYSERLDYCTAELETYDNYIALRSYNTIVAVYSKSSDTIYDVLRYVYGYTATSAKHISKFKKLFAPCCCFTYRDI